MSLLNDCGVLLLHFFVLLALTDGAVIHDVDWVTKQYANQTVPLSDFVPTGYRSELGLLQHLSSRRVVHPDGAVACPGNGATLRLYSSTPNDGTISFRFVQVIGHYGYLEHSCGLVVHPKGGNQFPGDNTGLDLFDARHAASLFTVDHEQFLVVHRAGRVIHPKWGSADPGDGTEVVLHSGSHDSTRFRFVEPLSLSAMSVYPTPDLIGTWRVIYAVLNPLVDHEYKLSFSIGASVTKSATEGYEWRVSAGVSFGWFQASTEYRKWAEITESVTWEAQIYRELTIKVPAGITVVTWQYFFEADQFGDGLRFRSTILADTNDINTPPQLSQVLANY